MTKFIAIVVAIGLVGFAVPAFAQQDRCYKGCDRYCSNFNIKSQCMNTCMSKCMMKYSGKKN